MKRTPSFFLIIVLTTLSSVSFGQITLLSEGFESVSTGCSTQGASCYHDNCQPAGWVTSTGYPFTGTTSSPHTGSKAMQCRYGWTGWMITSGVALTAGTTYTFSYWYKNTVGEASAFTMNAGVSNVGSQCPTMNTLGSVNVAANTNYTQHLVTYTPTASGTYYFGFRNSNTTFNGTQINVDDVLLTAPNCTVTPVTVNSAGTYCGQATLLASGGTGGTIYFQGTTSGGTSTATPASAQVVTASGTYYFTSFDGSCWGTEGSATVTINAGPCKQWLNQNCTICPKGCYIDAGTITPTRALQAASTATDTSNYGYVFWSFNASADSTYYFDLCASTGTGGMSWLRLHNARNTSPTNNFCMDAGNTPTLVLQNIANGCAGTGTGLSKLIWTCRTSGTYYLESAGANLTFWGVQGNQTATLNYKTLPSFSSVCSEVFYDKGIDGTDGSSNKYNNNEDWIYTYYPTDTIGSAISAQFTSFSTSPGDILCVYDGNSINAPMIGCYGGPSITGAFSSTASDGSLTFQFTSDDSLASAGWQANISCVENVSVHNYASANSISVYPNPAGNELRVRSHELSDRETKLEINNVLGEKVYSRNYELRTNDYELEVDVSNLSPGIYFVRLESETGKWNGRFVKQ